MKYIAKPAIILMLVLLVGLFAGCGRKTEKADNGAAKAWRGFGAAFWRFFTVGIRRVYSAAGLPLWRRSSVPGNGVNQAAKAPNFVGLRYGLQMVQKRL